MQTASPSGVARPKTPTQHGVVINQSDVYENILQKLDSEGDLGKLEWVLISYVTSLSENNIFVQHNINEMVVTTAVSNIRDFVLLIRLVFKLYRQPKTF